MASVSMSLLQLTCASHKRQQQPISGGLFRPLSVRPSKRSVVVNPKCRARFEVQASLKEKAVAGLSAGLLTASVVVPEVAEAAGSAFSPSLKNFLLSIVSGGVVLVAIMGAVIGVSNFDPVKRT